MSGNTLVVPWRTLLVLCALSRALHGEESPRLALDIVAIERGNREASFGDDPQKFAATAVYKAAQKSGIDLQRPEHPLLVFRYDAGRLFYLFYNDVTNVPDGRYLIQRVKRTTVNYSPDGRSTTEVAYLVEAFKSAAGRSKRPDQHFGSYSLQGHERREIIKEFEVGLGEIPAVAEGEGWPFESGKLYRSIQPYGGEAGHYDRVTYQDSLRWTLRVSFDRHGNYELRCPELGIKLVRSLPIASPGDEEVTPGGAGATAQVEFDPSTMDIVLQPGRGALGIVVGETRLEDARRLLGEPQEVQRLSAAANHHFSQQITLNIPDGEAVHTLVTRPGFGGRTEKGIRHGDTRDKVREVYGAAIRGGGPTATYDGVIFWFDEEDRVNRIVILPFRRS